MKLKFLVVFLLLSFFLNAQSESDFNLILKNAELYLSEKNEDSITYYNNKLTYFKNEKKFYKNYLNHLLNTSRYYQGNGFFEKSINVLQDGLEIADKFNDSYFKSKIYIEISVTYRIFHDYQKAIDYGKLAVTILNDNKKTTLKAKANALSITAAAFNENNQTDSAFVLQKRILNFLPQLDSTDIKNNIVNIGYTYMLLGDLENAKLYTERGLNLYKPTKSSYALGAIYTNLAMYGRRDKKYDYALKMFDSAIYYTKKSKYIETYVWIYDERAQLYKAIGDYKNSSKDFESLLKIKDSIFNTERDQTIQNTEVRFKTSKKEKEIALQKEALLQQELELRNKTLYTTLLTGSLVILAIVFIAVYKRNQLKRTQLKKEIELKDALATIKTQNRLQEQRLRISRDLHDNIGSQLTFIISSLDNLKFLSKDVNAKLKDKLTGISSFTSETIYQLRDTIWAMNKSEISIEDLHTRILSFVEKAKTAVPETNFKVIYTIDKNTSFSSLVGMNIFRVIQEAINNAIKYAEAKAINIDITKNGKDIIISVKDNGIGFSITEVTLGNGLSNMEKRMSEIDGKVLIDSKKRKGTTVTIKTKINTAFDV
jgi:signal transduction histidine kinase